MQFWLEYGAQRLELRPGVTLIGRSSSCQVVLNDGLVSRQHARLATTASDVTLEDLGSVNGVFVNEERVEGKRVLQSADRLVVGAQVMTLRVSQSTARVEPHAHATTLHGVPSEKLQSSQPRRASLRALDDSDTATSTADLLEVLGSLAEKNLALGRGTEAERILQGHLEAVLRSAASGDFRASSIERAASYAVKLAAATGKGSWIEYTFRLYTLFRRPLPRATADDIYSAMNKAAGAKAISISLTSLRDYLSVLHSVQNELTPAERFVVQRLEGLERLLAAK